MNEINKLFNNFEKKFIARVNMQVKQAVEQNEDFITKSLININKQSANSTEPLDIKSLTQRLLRLEGQVIELKRTSKPYALGVQVRDMFHKFEKLSADMNEIVRRQDIIDTETFLDTSISPEQLKNLGLELQLKELTQEKGSKKAKDNFENLTNPKAEAEEAKKKTSQALAAAEAAKKETQEIINDLINAAYNNGKENLKKKSAEELSKVTGGLNLPMDFKLPF